MYQRLVRVGADEGQDVAARFDTDGAVLCQEPAEAAACQCWVLRQPGRTCRRGSGSRDGRVGGQPGREVRLRPEDGYLASATSQEDERRGRLHVDDALAR